MRSQIRFKIILMKNFYLIIVFIFISGSFKTQNKYQFFPRDQHCYLGGFPEFYKDFHKVIIENNLQPCENKNELLYVNLLINPDNSTELLENKSSQTNKCAFELAKTVFKKMDKWIPAKIKGKEASTVARIFIYPDDLFENYKINYTIGKVTTKSNFDISNFRTEVKKRIDLSDFGFKGKGKLTTTSSFIINETGELDELEIIKSSGLVEFDEMFLNAIKRTVKKQKWEPAKIHEIPIRSRFFFPLSIAL